VNRKLTAPPDTPIYGHSGPPQGTSSSAMRISNALTLFDLGGHVAVVTGGYTGIGIGIARGFASAGAAVVIVDRDPARSAAALTELRARGADVMTIDTDLGGPEAVNAMVESVLARFGRIDVLVTKFGSLVRRPTQEGTPGSWRSSLDPGLRGALLCAEAAYPAMRRDGGGKVIVVGSTTSIFSKPPPRTHSNETAGVAKLTRSLAVEWAKDNIQVNAILPGWVDTEVTRKARDQVLPDLDSRVVARTPQGRWGVPDDFAGVAIFLASRASDFMTGATVAVDGGYSAL
jgi:2-deoxy-D-gluconate 3-dehydrogenase